MSAYAGAHFSLANSFTSQNRPIVGGWVELGRTTLGSGATSIDVSSLADKRYLMVLGSTLGTAAAINQKYTFNADTGSNYAHRYSLNGGADVTATSQTFMYATTHNSTLPEFSVEYIANLNTKEKLVLGNSISQNTAGAGTAPLRQEYVMKHAQTTNPIDQITMVGDGANNYNTGSEVVVLGWDPADTHTTNFWEELASVDLSGGAAATLSSGTITAKKYLWVQYFQKGTGGTFGEKINFNSDSGTNYALRRSINGGADALFGNLTSSGGLSTQTDVGAFANLFIINNSANEKLGIWHGVDTTTAGAGTATNRGEKYIKWANTSSQITEIVLGKDGGTATNMDTSTIMKVWGSD